MIEEIFKRKEVNLDISHRCALECMRCARTKIKDLGEKIPGGNISIENFKKVISYFNYINFCGQHSDPVHHPNFIEILKMCQQYDVRASVHNASSAKSKEWYIEAFKANVNARWIFGIDGLPETSCLYRINQDGVKLFNIMIESKKYLMQSPIWQVIVFSYNENDIDKCKKIADENEIFLKIIQSSRWKNDHDPLMPKSGLYKMKRQR